MFLFLYLEDSIIELDNFGTFNTDDETSTTELEIK